MATNIVPCALHLEDLKNDSYTNWSYCVKNYLLAQDLWDIVETTTEPPKPKDVEDFKAWRKKNATDIVEATTEPPKLEDVEDSKKKAAEIVEVTTEPPKLEDAEGFNVWRKKNAAALHAILISCGPDILSDFRTKEISSAEKAWRRLAELHRKKSSDKSGVVSGNENNIYLPLYKDVSKGDWDAVKKFLDDHPGAEKEIISENIGQTALHVTSLAGHVKIVEELVELMSDKDMEKKDEFGETALSLAAFNGTTKIVKCLHEKNKNLVRIVNKDGDIPLIRASSCAQKDVTHFLYRVTPPDLLCPENGMKGWGGLFLNNIIAGEMFDIALDVLHRFPHLATAINKSGFFIGLDKLSCMPHVFRSSITKLPFWQQWIYHCIQVNPPACFGDDRLCISQQGQRRPRNVVLEVDDLLPSFGDDISQNGQRGSKNIILQVLRRLVSNLLKFLGIKDTYEMKLNHLQASELLRQLCKAVSILNVNQLMEGDIVNVIFKAVENGIVEFITELIIANPDMMLIGDSNGRSVFMYAIECRQEKIFNLVHGMGARKEVIISAKDASRCNMLHLTGMLTPHSQLAQVSGAALQMQRELQWFKELESIMPPVSKGDLNNDNQTPRQVFTSTHKDLVKEGQKWMKDTATSCSVAGALIITIMFAAAFTVPGGNDQNTGFPIFLHENLFMVFIISDAISLFSSSTSVLMFLRILTSRYEEDDFLKSLPRKLIIGLVTLFISVATMMIAFSAALLIMLKGRLQIAIPVVSLASIPVALFLWLQFPLLFDILKSTYRPSIFDRKMKPWL